MTLEKYTNTNYQIVTTDNKFNVQKIEETDINILVIGHITTSFKNLDEVKRIIAFLNTGNNFFEINDEEYWVRDNRNSGLRNLEEYHPIPKYKIIKIVTHVTEEKTEIC